MYDFIYIIILGLIYYGVYLLIDKIFLLLGVYNLNIGLFDSDIEKSFLFIIPFTLINFFIYFLIKLFNHKHLNLDNTLLHRLLFISLKLVISYFLLLLLIKISWIVSFVSTLKFFDLTNIASIAFSYFFIVRICLNTVITKPLWYARAIQNSKDSGYKDIGFYIASWCGDVFYVGTANDGTGKRMYNYYTGKGCSDGDKFAGMRLGLRFLIVNTNNPDIYEIILYIIFGAPYKNRENPLRSQNVKKTSNYKNQ